MIDLSLPGACKALSQNIAADIDDACVELFDDGHRTHLGASIIGHKCSLYLWFVFRWVHKEEFDGRKLRLFNRGHREEERFIQYLEQAGFKVWYEDRKGFAFNSMLNSYFILGVNEQLQQGQILISEDDPDYKKHVGIAKLQGVKFPQFRVSDCEGHFGGSMDAVIMLPAKYQIAHPLLSEFKTNGTGAGFNNLTAHGLQLEKPTHFAQTSVYGYKQNLSHVLYLNANKNDDSIHVEVAKLDFNEGASLIKKASDIIFRESDNPPAKLSLQPTHFECKMCSMEKVCHYGKEIDKNCRSCKNARPIENKQWFCSVHQGTIPKEFIPNGCDAWDAIWQS